MRTRLPAVFVSSLLILLFAYTAFAKFLQHSAFEIILSRVPYLSPGAAILAWLVPLSELVLVLLLLFHRTRIWGLYGSAALLSVFTVYLVVSLLSGVHLPCSCGGVIGALGWREHVGLNLFMITLSVFGIRGKGEW